MQVDAEYELWAGTPHLTKYFHWGLCAWVTAWVTDIGKAPWGQPAVEIIHTDDGFTDSERERVELWAGDNPFAAGTPLGSMAAWMQRSGPATITEIVAGTGLSDGTVKGYLYRSVYFRVCGFRETAGHHRPNLWMVCPNATPKPSAQETIQRKRAMKLHAYLLAHGPACIEDAVNAGVGASWNSLARYARNYPDLFRKAGMERRHRQPAQLWAAVPQSEVRE